MEVTGVVGFVTLKLNEVLVKSVGEPVRLEPLLVTLAGGGGNRGK